MLKVVEGKRVQNVQRCMALKSTLRMISTLSSSNIILSQPIPTMNLCTKLTSGNFTTSLVELSWLTIHAGLHFWRTIMRPKYLFQNCCKKKKKCRPKALTAIKPYYTFAVRRTGLPEVKTIFQRRHFCPCAPCTTGDFHHCLYQAFLGMYQVP